MEGVGWYRKHFTVAKVAIGRKIFLDVDGAMSHAVVWCNGRFAGGWPYGYASFRVDLTPFLKTDGENVLAVRLENPPASSRWYPGAGIYRHVWLVETAPLHVAQWGGAVETPVVHAEKATLRIKTTLDNDGAAGADAAVRTEIFECDAQGQPSGHSLAVTPAKNLAVPPSTRARTEAEVDLPAPKFWDLAHPNLYVAVTTVSSTASR